MPRVIWGEQSSSGGGASRNFRNGLWNVIIKFSCPLRPVPSRPRWLAGRGLKNKTLTNLRRRRRVNFIPLLRTISRPRSMSLYHRVVIIIVLRYIYVYVCVCILCTMNVMLSVWSVLLCYKFVGKLEYYYNIHSFSNIIKTSCMFKSTYVATYNKIYVFEKVLAYYQVMFYQWKSSVWALRWFLIRKRFFFLYKELLLSEKNSGENVGTNKQKSRVTKFV
jgi:hypothetical protein